MSDVFYTGTDWQSSSGPMLTRQVHEDDLWPEGENSENDGTGDKDELEDGMHQAFAIGPKATRPVNLVGVSVSMQETTGLVQMNIAPGFIFKAYVANALTYSNHSAATFDQSLAVGEPVYVDDSEALASGVTLSRSPLACGGEGNPLCGFIWYDQDDYADFYVRGPNTSDDWPKTVDNSLVYTKVSVLLWGCVY